MPFASKRDTRAFSGLGALIMRDLFAVPWLTRSRRILLSIGAVLIVVFGLCALLKVNGGEGQVPAKELLTGSITKAAAVRRSASDDPIVAFLSPASTQLTTKPIHSTLMDRRTVPLPRPRPKRL
jgi:hypothetical protein